MKVGDSVYVIYDYAIAPCTIVSFIGRDCEYEGDEDESYVWTAATTHVRVRLPDGTVAVYYISGIITQEADTKAALYAHLRQERAQTQRSIGAHAIQLASLHERLARIEAAIAKWSEE